MKNKQNIVPIIGITVLILIALLKACSVGNTSSAKPSPTVPFDEVIATIDKSTNDTFGTKGDYSVEVKDTIILVNVWSPDVTSGALKAAKDPSVKADWDKMTEQFVTAQKSLQNYVDRCGYTDYTVSLDIMNSINTERALLVVSKGQVLYDIVNGVDKLS